MYEVHDLVLGFARKRLLEHASLTLEPGRVTGLIAPNGFGKTTLLRWLAGNRSLGQASRRMLDGHKEPKPQAIRSKVFYMPGDGSLLNPQLSGRDHLQTAAQLWKSSADIAQVVTQCSMEPYIEWAVRRLSQGMAQQLALACAYVAQPKYLLLDEPMNALDPTHAESNGHYLRALARRGSAVLFSSHILDNVTAVCDSVLTMEGRRLTEHENTRSRGFAAELYRRTYQTVNDAPGSAASRPPPR